MIRRIGLHFLGVVLVGIVACGDDSGGGGTEGTESTSAGTMGTAGTGATSNTGPSSTTDPSTGPTTSASTTESTVTDGTGTDSAGTATDGGSTGEPYDPTTGAALNRVTDGLAVLYRFNAGGGTVVQDVSGVGSPLDLASTSATGIAWNATTLSITGSTRLAQQSDPTKITSACGASGAVTLEAWVRAQSNAASGMVMTLSTATNTDAFRFAQSGGQWEFFILTGGSPPPPVVVSANVETMSHVVITRSGMAGIDVYIDGQSVTNVNSNGNLSGWPADAAFALANRIDNSAPFLGEFGLAAVYCRALSAAEVTQNFDAGF